MTIGDFTPPRGAQDTVIVLVETEHSLNIGSVARAMMNLGYSQLRLVAPKNYNFQKACVTGRWAVSVLENTKEYADLESAVADLEEVVGFGIKPGHDSRGNILLGPWADSLQSAAPKKLGLVFGPEDTGLTYAHMELCRWIVRIPSTAAYQSYNLAQSVLLTLFELSRFNWPAEKKDPPEQPQWNDFFQLDRMMAEILSSTGFYRKGDPDAVPGVIKNLVRRMEPDRREMGLLLAMFNRIEECLKQPEIRNLPVRKVLAASGTTGQPCSENQKGVSDRDDTLI